MALTPEQVLELKRQLREQVQSMAEPQRSQALQQIEAMSDEALEAMLEQQRSGQQGGGASPSGEQKGPQKGVFRMIVDGEIPSKKLSENKDAVAVLDIKPIAKGHVVIIPKKAVSDPQKLSAGVFSLGRVFGKKIVSKLGAGRTEIQTETKFGEAILNVIPVYDESKPVSVHSQRYDASEDELAESFLILRVVKRAKKEVVKVARPKKEGCVIRLPRRIP